MLDRRRHPFYRNSDGAFFLAVDDGCATGRVAVLDNVGHNGVVEGGYHCAGLVQIGLENDKMQRELQGLGIDFYKTHRMYQRLL